MGSCRVERVTARAVMLAPVLRNEQQFRAVRVRKGLSGFWPLATTLAFGLSTSADEIGRAHV